jgi:hypothetical protein
VLGHRLAKKDGGENHIVTHHDANAFGSLRT